MNDINTDKNYKSGNIIEVKNLVKEFKGLRAVDNISFSVKEDEIFGFLGPNGAGKTTTINMICTLLSKTSGSITLNGHSVDRERNKIRNCIGMVFQDPSLDDRLTALENLHFHGLLYNIPRRTLKKRAEEVLGIVNLTGRENSLVMTYSGGMRRRLEIARGLLHYPRVLFLDEPTLGLDPQTRNKIWDYIIRLRKNRKITIFLTSHYMEETEICDRIAVIDRGKIIALDSPENLKNMIGGDIITLTSEDNARLKEYANRMDGIEVHNIKEDKIRFEVKNSSEFIPKLIKESPVKILSITARKPTLNDVFLELTGREIREESASLKDNMRMRIRRRMRH
ncbi:MAG: ATP-binding cassette domain-containing protein [Actinomycetota bacterium]|nr:ATP-binding cassette domain-containing protein [Actinomycetota bacterium]